jgi:phage terminase large subunit-like protein
MDKIEQTITDYINGVISGRVPAGELIKKAVQRHLDDLKSATRKKMTFNKSAAKHAIEFFAFLKQSKDEWAGEPFVLEPWQMFVLWVVFGWYNNDGMRRFHYIYIEVAKKNGKTTWMAGVGLYCFIADGVNGAEVYTAATSRNQAKICFHEAQNMVRQSDPLRRIITNYTHNMHIGATMSKFQPLTAQYESNEGINPSCAIVDEFHVHKTTVVFDLIKSAMGSRMMHGSPSMWVITTAGFDKSLPCYQYRHSCIEILKGIKHQDNTAVFIYAMDEDDDWRDPANWPKPNPNLNVSVSLKYLRDEFQMAINRGGSEAVNFKTKNLNMWVDAQTTWIKDDQWLKCGGTINMDELIGRPCYLGVDLTEKYDVSALALLFPPQKPGERFLVVWKMWIPQQKVIEKQDFVDWRVWVEGGHVTMVDGNVVDDDLMIDEIMHWAGLVDIQMLGFDEWNAKKFITDLIKRGFPEEKVDKIPQVFSQLSEPTKFFYGKVIDGQLCHGDNPVIRWMVNNVVIKTDTNNNVRIDKGKSREKIDGVSAGINAMVVFLNENNGNSINDIYSDNDL